MNVVCVPYRRDTEIRAENWHRTLPQWDGWDLYFSDSDGEQFSRAQACNRAAAQAGDWDAMVVADSDLLLDDPAQAVAALELARSKEGYVTCYDTLYYLDEPNSQEVRAGATPTPKMSYFHYVEIWGGMFAIHRKLWDALEGFDEVRFTSWGGEDVSLLVRLDEIEGFKGGVPGDCYHLKHPLTWGAPGE
jgi:hypothetical protein